MIERSVAIAGARRWLESLRVEDHPGAAAARVTAHAGVPLLVYRRDAPGQQYYLIPWQDERGIVLIVQVDAQNGAMSSMAELPMPLQRLTASPEDALRTVSDRLGLRATGESRLVWQPCREAASPFQPLYEIPVAGGQVFVGVDGSVHRSLTPFMKGG